MELFGAATSSNSALVYLALGVVFGLITFFASEQFKRRWGRTPWGWPSAVWGIVGFLSLLLCVILMVLASWSTKRRVQSRRQSPSMSYGSRQGMGGPGGYGYSPSYGASPGYPQQMATQLPPVYPPRPAAQTSADTTSPPAGWHGDPSGRHELRYWDGSQWTENVSDGGTASTDPAR